jgi:hypothetical protein
MRAPPPGPRETRVLRDIRSALESTGWFVQKTHGSAYSAGWPDLMCFRSDPGLRWVEVKRPGGTGTRRGRLTRAQRVRFAEWEAHGLGVWVICAVTEIEKLFGPPNWREWE